MGDEYDIKEITDSLNITPSKTWKKGDFIRNSGQKHTYTAWIYDTDAVETLDVQEQTKKIEKLFLSRIERIISLKKKYRLDISLDFVIIIENDEVPAVYFEPSFLEFAAKIGARFDIDMYIN